MTRLRRAVVTILAITTFWLLFIVAADAHTPAGQAEWYGQWEERASLGLTPELLAELLEFRERHEVAPSRPTATVRASGQGMGNQGSDVERWRGLVAAHFPANAVNTMLCLMRYESGGNPNATNPSSGAAGLLQVMPFWWDHYGGDRYDPDTNIRVARLIWDQQGYGAWSPWNRGRCR